MHIEHTTGALLHYSYAGKLRLLKELNLEVLRKGPDNPLASHGESKNVGANEDVFDNGSQSTNYGIITEQ